MRWFLLKYDRGLPGQPIDGSERGMEYMSTSKEHMDVLEPLFVFGLDRLGWLIRALNVFHAPDRKSDNCNCSPATGGTHPMILCPSFLPPLSLTHSSSFSPFIEPCFLSASLSEWVSDSFPSFFLTSFATPLPLFSSLSPFLSLRVLGALWLQRCILLY